MNHRPTGRLSALTLALALSLSAPAVLAAPVEFHISAQSLDSALRAFAEQSRVELLYAPDLVRSHSAAAVEGSFEPEEALQRLLAGTGLRFERSETGTFLLTAIRSDLALGTVVTTATRTEQRITDVPAAVSVVTRSEIERQQAHHATDLLRNLEGIDVHRSATLGSSDVVRVRGVGASFSTQTSPILLDGMLLESPVTSIHVGLKVLQLEDMEQLEVVRGPSSALYGPSAVGGVINMISRRWERAPGGEVRLGAGSNNSRSVGVAAGGAWNALDLRVSASDYSTDGYIAQPDPDPWGGKDLAGRDGSERKYALQGAWRPTDHEEITFAARNATIKSAWLGGHPNYRLNDDVSNYDLGYRRELSDIAVMRVNFRHLRQEANGRFDYDSYNGDGDLSLAENVFQTDYTDQLDVQGNLRLSERDLLTLGYTNAYGKYTLDDDVIIDGYTTTSVAKSRLDGIYFQEQHRFGDKLTLLAGARWDRFEFYGDRFDSIATGNESTDRAVSPRISALYQATPATGLYAAVGTAFVPAQNGLKFRGNTIRWRDNPDLDPEHATSYEAGLHHTSGGWLSRFDLYHVDYTDKISPIVVDPATGQKQYQNIGKTTVDGVEFSVRGEIEGGWQPWINYAYTDSLIRENPTDPALVGNHMQWISPNKLNVGLAYAPRADYFVSLEGRYVDAIYTDDANSDSVRFPRLPPYFVADLKAGWQLPTGESGHKLELTFALNNLFDRTYREYTFENADRRNFWLGLNTSF